MAGDDLSIFLFWVGLAIAFGLEAMKADARSHRIGFGGFASFFLLLGLFWTPIKSTWPPLEKWVAAVATDPASWFMLFMFVAAVFAFGGKPVLGKKAKEGDHKPAAAPPRTVPEAAAALAWPTVSDWKTPIDAISKFVNEELSQAISDSLIRRDRVASEYSDAEDAYRKKYANPIDQINEISHPTELGKRRSNLSAQLSLAETQVVISKNKVVEELIRQLRSGDILARGVLSETGKLHSEWEYFRPAHWVTLRLTGDDLETATGGGRVYKGIQIGKPTPAAYKQGHRISV